MKVKCEHCGSYIPDTLEKCPNCGATNVHMMRSAQGVPKTIEELQAFCDAHQMPLEKMRFFIGKDYRGAKAFGICRDEKGDVVVYKNKADGSRAVRYQGSDEAYAVNELYQKLKSEVLQRKASGPHSKRRDQYRTGRLVLIFMTIALAAVVAFFAFQAISSIPDRGYYGYQGDSYYYSADTWYLFDTAAQSWQPTSVSDTLTEHYGDYWQGSDYSSDYGSGDFSDSEYYQAPSENSSNDDDWDSGDWSYDYDSWDSSGTDWSSDW